jgi:putative membrane protein
MLNFLLYLCVVIAFWAVAIAVYVRLTPYPEFELVRQGNMAATASLIGTVLGLALPLASLAANAVNIVDLALWAGVALVVQLLCWLVLARLVFPWLQPAIVSNQASAGVLLGGFSAGIGLLNAACLTY